MCGRRGRYVIGTEKMNLQGIMCGTYRRGTLSQSKLADLAGNAAVHNACWAVVLLATYCCCAEAEPPTAPEASEVQAAAAAASTD